MAFLSKNLALKIKYAEYLMAKKSRTYKDSDIRHLI
jgi:hypothetical protein